MGWSLHAVLSFLCISYMFSILETTYSDSINRNEDPHTSTIVPSNIAFGSVLNEFTYVFGNDSDVYLPEQFALKFVRKYNPEYMETTSISRQAFKHDDKVQKLKLVYTSNDVSPAVFNMRDPVTRELTTMPLIMGVLYSFSSTWFTSAGAGFTHHFKVLEYFDDKFYMWEHYFHPYSARDPGDPCPTCVRDAGPLEKTRRAVEGKCGVLGTVGNSDGLCDTGEAHTDMYTASHPEAILGDTNRPDGAAGTIRTVDPPSDIHYALFSILTYNIWHTKVYHDGDTRQYLARIKRLAKLCLNTDADVIAFQEVRFEDGSCGKAGPNQLQQLAKLLPAYQFVFQPGQVQRHGLPHLIVEGVAIFTKHSIIRRNHILLSRNASDAADDHQRVLLHAEIDIPGVGPINVLNTHLSLSHEARLQSVREIWNYVKELSDPVFLTGDLNAEKHNEEVRFLAGKETVEGHKTHHFHDIWELKYGYEESGFTFSTLDPEFSKRIDFIFMREHPAVVLDDVRLLDDGKRRHEAASDHIGVIGHFKAKVLATKTPSHGL